MIEIILYIGLGFLLGMIMVGKIYKLSGKEMVGYFWKKPKPDPRFINSVRVGNDQKNWVEIFKASVLNGVPTFTNWKPDTPPEVKEAFWNEIKAWSKKMGMNGRISIRNNLTGQIISEEKIK